MLCICVLMCSVCIPVGVYAYAVMSSKKTKEKRRAVGSKVHSI